MKKSLLLVVLSFIAIPLFAGTLPKTITKKIIYLGQRPVPFKITTYGDLPVRIINLHDNENTGVTAAHKIASKYGGTVIELENRYKGVERRNITFKYGKFNYTIDPNRMFDDEGIARNLRMKGRYSVGAMRVIKHFAAQVHRLAWSPEFNLVVVMHNNGTYSPFSIDSYTRNNDVTWKEASTLWKVKLLPNKRYAVYKNNMTQAKAIVDLKKGRFVNRWVRVKVRRKRRRGRSLYRFVRRKKRVWIPVKSIQQLSPKGFTKLEVAKILNMKRHLYLRQTMSQGVIGANKNINYHGHDFFFTTKQSCYDYLKQKGFNVVLQQQERISLSGSYSTFARNMGVDYINSEALYGNLDTQIKMMEAVYGYVRHMYPEYFHKTQLIVKKISETGKAKTISLSQAGNMLAGENMTSRAVITARSLGNENNEVTITLDPVAPEVAILSPKNRIRIENEIITVTGNSKDIGTGIDSIFLAVDEGNFEKISINPKWTHNVKLTPGFHTIYVKSMDKAGNASLVKQVEVIVDSISQTEGK